MKPIIIFMIILIFFFTSIGCKMETQPNPADLTVQAGIEVYNFDNAQSLKKYNDLNLDATHPNLLNPQISQSDVYEVRDSWTKLHQRIGKHLNENDFSWETSDSTINIVHKIYFTKNGEIKSYFFNVLNEDITEKKKEEFANLIVDFAKDNHINIRKENDFAQCGKTKYLKF